MKFLYRLFIAPLGVLLYFMLALPFSKKAKEIFKLRQSARLNRPDFMQGCYWIHASSGEFEYAKAVIREILSNDPAAKIVATYSSPSYAKQITSFAGISHAEPLPFDLQAPVKEFIKHFQPRILLISRTDLWPEILWQCGESNIPRVLFSCSFPKTPSGLSMIWKKFVYSFLDYIFVIKDSDLTVIQDKLVLKKVKTKSIGDTRFDQVLFRLSQAKIPERTDDRFCILAGSTWEHDEAVILPALAELLKDNTVQLILVPHEPTAKHTEKLEEILGLLNIGYSLYSKSSYDFTCPVIIIDQVGVLATLYPLADLSFIGGSFKSEVHSVMESLGAGCLSFVGPKYKNNREALDFANIPVTAELNMVNVVQDKESLTEFVKHIIQHRYELDDIQAAILAEVQKRKGASHNLVREIERILNV